MELVPTGAPFSHLAALKGRQGGAMPLGWWCTGALVLKSLIR